MSLVEHYNICHKYISYKAELRNALLKEIDHREPMPEPEDNWSYGLDGIYMDFTDYIEAFWLNLVYGMTFQDCWKHDLNCNRGTDRPSTGLAFKRNLESNTETNGESE